MHLYQVREQEEPLNLGMDEKLSLNPNPDLEFIWFRVKFRVYRHIPLLLQGLLLNQG